ncbi:MAG: hypothetical protein U5N10_06845 [Gemmobacter sp.]|nr:hypothetical protein [Gemmobacter sp.]
MFLPGVSFRLEDGKRDARSDPYPQAGGRHHLWRDKVAGACWRAIRRAMWSSGRSGRVRRPDKMRYLALYDMNRADQGQRADYLARVQQKMRQF